MSALRIRGTDLSIPFSVLKPWAKQIENNYGGSPVNLVERGVDLTAEELWLAAHGKPVVANQVTEAQALEWVRSLLPKPKAEVKAEGKK